jgi:hypothetical protein
VHVQYCLAEGTVDDWMWRTVERKLSVTGSTLNGRDALQGGAGFAQHQGVGAASVASVAGVGGAAGAEIGSHDLRMMLGARKEPPGRTAEGESAAAKRLCQRPPPAAREVISLDEDD